MTQKEFETKMQEINGENIARKAELHRAISRVEREKGEAVKEFNRLQQLVIEKKTELNRLKSSLSVINIETEEKRVALKREYELSNSQND